jgi:predicted dehydrogenase
MTETLKVAVVGSGIGRSHIQAYRNLSDLFDVVALCDVDTERAKPIAESSCIPCVVGDLEAVCTMDDVDIVDICTPSYLHYPHVKQVLGAGKHVVCEKPVAGSLREIDHLIHLEAELGRRVMPIFQNRFGHGLQKLKLLIDKGVTGRAYLTTIETSWRRRAEYYAVPWRGKWETELGGPLVTLAIHAHDVLCYVLGPVSRVYAEATTRVNPIETEDCLAASVRMADGSLAALSVTTGSAAEVSRFRFCFEGLSAESCTQPYAPTADPWQFTGDSPEKEERIADVLAKFEPLPEGYEGQFSRFHRAVTEGGELPVSLADARVSLDLITALYSSVETGKPVDLPIGDGHPRYGSWRPGQSS